MLNIETKTKLTREEVIKHANKYFQGYGLKVVDQSPCSVSYEGGGGGVRISTSTSDGITTVEIVSQEWDYQTNIFIESLPKHVSIKNKL